MSKFLKDECIFLSNYLIGCDPNEKVLELYSKAIDSRSIHFTPVEIKLWAIACKNKFCLSCLDSALRILDPDSNIRFRLIALLAILETQPEYLNHFDNQIGSQWNDYFRIGIKVIMSFPQIFIGIIIIKSVRGISK